MGLADTAKLFVNLSLGGNFSSGISKATRDLKKFDHAVDHSKSRSYQAGQQIGNGIKNLAKVGLVAATGIAAVAAAAVHAAGDFEAQLNTINTIARATPAQLGKIGEGIRKIARDTGTSLDDLTSAYYDLLSAGIKTADAQKVLTLANTLAIGGLATTAETVDLLTTAINAYGGDASKAAQYTDDFAKAIEIGKVKASEISSSFANVASIAHTAGISVREIAASYGFLTAQGVHAAEVTTQMSRAIIELLKPGKDLAALQGKLHTNYAALAKQKGLVPALQQMRIDAAKAKIPFQDLFGRLEGYKFALATTGDKNAGFNDVMRQMGKDAGTAAAQMAERQKGLNFQLDRLGANARDAAIQIGSALLPKLTPLLEKLNAFVSSGEGQKAIADVGTAIAGLFSDSNIKAGMEAFQGTLRLAQQAAPVLADAARIVGAVVSTAVSLFTSLPPQIQALAIGAFAINKLTGGLVTNLVGGLAGIVGKSLGIIKAPVVNVQGGVVKVGGAGAGGVPGAAGKGLSTIGKVALIGETIGLVFAVNEVRQSISDASTAQATQVQGQTAQFIASQPSKAAIQNALDGVNQGIHDLEFNPLNVLVQGDALEKLRQMRADLQGALKRTPAPYDVPNYMTQAPKTDKVAAAIQAAAAARDKETSAAIAANARQVGGDIETMRGSIATGLTTSAGTIGGDIETMRGNLANGLVNTQSAVNLGAQQTSGATTAAGQNVAITTASGDSRIVAAVNAIPAPQTFVDVNISASSVSSVTTKSRRKGPSGGSRSDDLRDYKNGMGGG